MGRVLQPFEYFEPTSLAEARELAGVDGARYMAGGCELVLRLRRGDLRAERIVSLQRVQGLDDFRCDPGTGLEAGALITLRTLANDTRVARGWTALHEAIDRFSQPIVANSATLAGNLCCATPYYDMATALLALRAELSLHGAKGERKIALGDFYTAPGRTALERSEIVRSVSIPPPDPGAGSAFLKIVRTIRRHNDLPKISAAASVTLDTAGDTVTDATVVIGSWDFRPVRIDAAERAVTGAPATTDTWVRAAEIAVGTMKPVTGVSWIEDARAQQARVLVRDALEQAAGRARSKHDPARDPDTIEG